MATGDGTPVGTQCFLQYQSGDGRHVTLDDQKHWQGNGLPPPAIQDQFPGNFTHIADAKGSIGGVAYVLENTLKWVVAWSNEKDQSNKVYIQILEATSPIDWELIKTELQNCGNQCKATNLGYKSEAEINATSDAPQLKATLSPAVPAA